MIKISSFICLAVGIWLIYWGHGMAQSLNGQMNNLLNGSPGSKPMLLYLGGTVLIVIGLGQLVWKRK